MTLNDLYNWVSSSVPEADESVIPSDSSTQLSKKQIFNEGEREWVKLTKCFPAEKKFDVVAGNYTYSLIDNVPDFLSMRPEGVWHLRSDTSENTWDYLKPITIRVLDQLRWTWRTLDNSDYVQYYWEDGENLGFHYTPSTAVTNGFLIYYYATSSQMTSLTDHPFTGSKNSTRLEPYHKHIITYYESRALEILGFRDDSMKKKTEFYQLAGLAKSELQERQDIAQSAQARPMINRPSFKGGYSGFRGYGGRRY